MWGYWLATKSNSNFGTEPPVILRNGSLIFVIFDIDLVNVGFYNL